MMFFIKIFSTFVLSICAEIGSENIIINALLSTDGTPEQQSIFILTKMKEVQLTNGKFAQVDDEDYDLINQYKWSLQSGCNTFYAKRGVVISGSRKNFKSTTQMMHRLIIGLTNGDKKIVDHIDGNGLNNQKSNLRICTAAQNATNRLSCHNSTSKYLGVSFCKQTKKWRATISPNNNKISLGRHSSEEDAAKAYNDAAIKYYGKFANLNKI